jgi:glycosyltransferase involved in cell wall biosynthesis
MYYTYVVHCRCRSCQKVAIGTNSPLANVRTDVRSTSSLTSAVGQPIFLGSNDTTGPLGVVIQHICGNGVCRVDFTSTRYGISGNDLSNNTIHAICTHFGSKLVTITMSHWIFGNTSHYPELENDFDGPAVRERLALFESIDSYILTGSTNSYSILKHSLFKNIKSYVIPFPFDEVDTYDGFVEKHEKSILWGTQQPLNPRKGKVYFEEILKKLYELCDNPNDILIKQIGPKVQLNTNFKVEQLGEIPNRLELSKVYKSSKVFALTTLADAGPMMALECIKNQTPLVSFATNISTDLVDDGKNGYIAESIDEYANYLYDIIYNNQFHIDNEHVKKFNSEKSVDENYQLFFDKILEK